eukprot:m.446710 g.446710  ORF g.446710 m.446710 type:complete len:383 (-) comp56872_c0_seq1:1107-2255(-)
MRVVVSSGNSDGLVKLYNADDGSVLETKLSGSTMQLAIDEDRLLLAVACGKSVIFLGMDLQVRHTIPAEADVHSIAFVDHRPLLVFGTYAGELVTVNTETFTVANKVRANKSSTRDLHVMSCKTRVCTASWDHSVKIFDLDTLQLVSEFKGHDDYVLSVRSIRADKVLVSGAYNKTVRIWNSGTLECVRTTKQHLGQVYALAANPDETLFASGCSGRVILVWDATTFEILHQTKSFGDVATMAFSTWLPNAVVVGQDNRGAAAIDFVEHKEVEVYTSHGHRVCGLAVSKFRTYENVKRAYTAPVAPALPLEEHSNPPAGKVISLDEPSVPRVHEPEDPLQDLLPQPDASVAVASLNPTPNQPQQQVAFPVLDLSFDLEITED